MNAFDKIATTPTTTKAKTVAIAKVTEAIKIKVDRFVSNKAELKRLEADQAMIESEIIDHVRPQQDEMAYCGSFTKSLDVPGVNNQIKFVTMDKFSVPQEEEAITELKKCVGETMFKNMFEKKRVITMKDAAIKNPTTLDKISAACEKAGLNIAEIFEVGDKLVAKDDLDVKQYELPKKKLDTFRSIVRQAKPSLRS